MKCQSEGDTYGDYAMTFVEFFSAGYFFILVEIFLVLYCLLFAKQHTLVSVWGFTFLMALFSSSGSVNLLVFYVFQHVVLTFALLQQETSST